MHDRGESLDVPLLTVVTPSFNQSEFIAQTIESVVSQDYPRIEYIVMDGGSTDGTLEVLRRYEGRLRWISENDAGQSDAIHRGFSLGSGDILAWLNADDLYAPGAVSRAVAALMANAGAGFVYGNADFIDQDGRPAGHQMRRSWDFDHLLNYRNFISQPATFFRRQAYEAVGGLSLDLHYVMDYDLWIKLGRRFEVVAIPETLALVRMYAQTKTASGGLARVREMRQMVARHGRSRLPEWHHRDLVRALADAAIGNWRSGRRRQALVVLLRTTPYLAHPMVIINMARFVGRRVRREVGRIARGDPRPSR